MSKDLPKTYEPKAVEGPLYREWEERGLFAPRPGGEPFSIVLPPPNVTGALHMGHALDHSIQDALVRQARMSGRRTLWLPGTDHAGIATQNVVERDLAQEGRTRHDLGREAFVERVWEWKRAYGGRITTQMRRLGDSCDWSRERFTMDPGLSRAVREAFVRLYEEGLIYRGNRIINWCPRCATALSDIETAHREVDGELIQIRYPLEGGSGYVVIATTRVETMLGDTAVAVHPDDERHRHLVGRTATLPLLGRALPIVADEAVDPEFGAGALKVTPAHDATDFEIARRHRLDAVNILTPEGRINENGGEYAGMDRYQARDAVLEALRAQGLVVHEERPFTHAVGHCSRCGTEVEPWLSDQWFVKVEALAREAIAAVRDGRTRFVPRRYGRNYLDWMENLRDWCISRQLWWGHRIPVWTCAAGHEFAAREDPSACRECGSADVTQDPDVLDTWFSSALWPFSTLGWPDDTEDLRAWYPTTTLVTGYDIITFWVSRMMMMGLHFMGRVPFDAVAVHGLVRDFKGKKMSKSFGNAIDPLDMADRYGIDALRMTLLRSSTLGGEVSVDEKWIEGDRNFANKLWNIARLVLMNLDGPPSALPPRERWSLADRWILSRLAAVTREVTEAFGEYDLARAASDLRQFAWSEVADWYLEWSKGRLYGEDERAKVDQRAMLVFVLDRLLRLLHPLMPFVTETLWRSLTGGDTLLTTAWPAAEDHGDEEAERDMAFLQGAIVSLRRFKTHHRIEPKTRPTATAVVADPRLAALLETEMERVLALGSWGSLAVVGQAPDIAGEARLVTPGAVIHVPLAGIIDVAAERARLRGEIAKHETEFARIEAKLADAAFVAKAPEEVVETQRERLEAARAALARLGEALSELGAA
ncbi:MAG: valine--tRNA ligase [Acidobacteria bacterium]|nr:valine--tRNA ligase [Acidobacteriota bacterium]